MPKNIVVFSDGTGQDSGVRPEQRVSMRDAIVQCDGSAPYWPVLLATHVRFKDRYGAEPEAVA